MSREAKPLNRLSELASEFLDRGHLQQGGALTRGSWRISVSYVGASGNDDRSQWALTPERPVLLGRLLPRDRAAAAPV